MKVEAMFYERIRNKIHCYLCPHNCVMDDGHRGKCNVRVHEDDKLYTINYGEITSVSLDPIEKKPLHFFRPGSYILSVGSYGCNFICDFCQNFRISQSIADSNYVSKESLVETVLKTENNIGIAFTYNEPSIWYEYVYDCAKLIKETDPGVSVALVTNGYISEEPLKKLLPYIDAMNIDLKSFSNKYYNKLCGGSLEPVLRTIEISSKSCHVEVTTLLVSGKNDNLEEIEDIAKFISFIDSDIPLHLSRYFPRYKMESPATDIEFMERAEEVSKKHLKKVVLGNV